MSKYDTHVVPNLDKIRNWVKEGATEREIAQALGISYSGFRKYKNEYDQLNGIMAENKIVADESAVGAFYKRVTGTAVIEEVQERIDGKLVTVKRTTKQIPPDVQAGQFWLTNRMPDTWRNKQEIKAEVTARKLEDFLE